jgi:hypothetical protein
MGCKSTHLYLRVVEVDAHVACFALPVKLLLLARLGLQRRTRFGVVQIDPHLLGSPLRLLRRHPLEPRLEGVRGLLRLLRRGLHLLLFLLSV